MALQLPNELREFIEQGRPLNYDADQCDVGAATLHPLDVLQTEYFGMYNAGPNDPNKEGDGSYLVKAISLVAECENYDPEGLLLWLPLDSSFGLWDGEHGNLLVFGSDVSWNAIAQDFPRFIHAHWGLDESTPVNDLEAWVYHNYSSERAIGPLPDIDEWYEASWTRRGDYQDGVQLRYPESIEVRLEQHMGTLKLASRYKPAENEADWTPTTEVNMSEDEWTKVSSRLESDFWLEATKTAYTEHGETDTMWSMDGFKGGQYRSLFRSYDESSTKGDRLNELGKYLVDLAGFPRLEAKK